MRAQGIALLAGIFASIAAGQAPEEQSLERLFHFTHVETGQGFEEMAMLIRSMAGIQRASTDQASRSLTVRGTPDQIALADWLLTELDRPADLPPVTHNSLHEYRMSASGDDTAQVVYLNHTATVQDLQEIVTLVRSITEVLRLFTYNSSRAVALRGTAAQLALADWLFSELDQPPDQSPALHRYPVSEGSNDLVEVVHVTHAANLQDFQEIVTLVRAITEIRLLFTYNAPRALALRGTAGQVALADWLFHELDKPAGQRSPVNEYRLPDSGNEIVRVFYLPPSTTVQDFQQIARRVYSTTKTRGPFTYNAPRALAVRGTANQIAQAEQVIKERQDSNPR